MTTAVASSTKRIIGAYTEKSEAQLAPRYCTKTSFVAVHFDEAGKGRIVFLPNGATLRVTGPSSCLTGGFEVMFENRRYNIFEADLLARSIPICEPTRANGRAVGACA
jgi:hypothetical protein